MTLIKRLQGKLTVSCQAETGYPLNQPDRLAAMAVTAVMGGASAIRASEPANIQAIRQAVDVPIIGIYKYDYPGFDVRITPTIDEVDQIAAVGTDIIAVDATARPRPDGCSLTEFIAMIRTRYPLMPLMADIATLEEGIEAARLGVDIVATTLSGYTKQSQNHPVPNFGLIQQLSAQLDLPVIAEGHISTPTDVQRAFAAGAYSVVVGSAITRPHLITERFVAATPASIQHRRVAAIDIGGTKIAGGVVTGAGKLESAMKIATPAGGGRAVMDSALGALDTLLSQDEIAGSVDAIGISTGGQIDRNGAIIGSTDMIPGWIDVSLQATVAQHFGLPTYMLNDGHAATLAESHWGAGQGYGTMLCVVIGTGLGGGVVIDGTLQHGATGLAGSIGQMKVTENGCDYVPLEALVSGPGLLRKYNDSVDSAQKAASSAEIAQRTSAGDLTAQQVITQMGEWLGLGLSHGLHMLDADVVVIGGSVAQIGPLLLESVRAGLAKYGYSTAAKTAILPAALGPQAGLLGAGLYALRSC